MEETPPPWDLEWEYNKTFNDWTLFVSMPGGYIRGTVAYTTHSVNDNTVYAVWGTVESAISKKYVLKVEKYNDPSAGIDYVSRAIIVLLQQIILKLSAGH